MIETPIHNVKLVVVDDDDGLRNLVRAMMQMFLNREIPAFINGLDAWEYLQENQVHIVISDIDMPFMNGLLLLENMKKKFPHTIFICMSAEPNHAKKAEELGADAFVGKPFNVNDFVHIVKHFITGEA